MTTFNIGPIALWDLELIREGTQMGVEDATEAWVEGALLVNASGKLAEASADPTALRGIAKKAASGTTSAPVEYWPIKPGRLYEATWIGTIAQTDFYANVGFTRDSTTKFWYLDTAQTEDTAQVVALAPGSTLSDTNPRVLFTFDSANVEGF